MGVEAGKRLVAAACSLVALAILPCMAQQSPSQQTGSELYLTLPFCLDSSMQSGLELKAAELKDAAENEKATGVCLAELSGLKPAARASSPLELERVDAYLEFALAVSAPAPDSEAVFRHLAAKRIATEAANLYFKAAAIQKALEDSAGMLSKQESDELHKSYDDARLALVQAICFRPVTDIRLDSGSLEEEAAKKLPPEEERDLRELSVVAEDGRAAEIKLSDEFKSQLGAALAPGLFGAKRLWMVAGCKAAKFLLSPAPPPSEKPLYLALAKLARAKLAAVKARDTQEALERLDAELKAEAEKMPGPALGSLIVRRDLALGAHCAALEAARDASGAGSLLKFAAPGLPSPQEEPPDPTLVEIPASSLTDQK